VTFVVRFASERLAPPRTVAMLTPLNGWRNIPGTYAEGGWTFSLDEAAFWTEPAYFKFLLDGRYWMDDPYIRIAPVDGETYTFDDERVSFCMSTSAPTATAVPATPPLPVAADHSPPVVIAPPAVSLPTISEGAVINRVVLLLTPFVTAAAAWVAGLIARHVPGVTLDQTQVVSFMIAIVAVCLAGAWKWLQGWQQHELLVAQRLAAPLKAVISAVPALAVAPPAAAVTTTTTTTAGA
jgi:hypothetical protein